MVHIPLPSPKGTNKARLFRPYLGRPDIAAIKTTAKKPVTMAMDAALSAGSTDTWEQLCALLQEHLPPDKLEEAYGHLEHLLNETDEPPAQDEPGPFPGRPNPGGTKDPLGRGLAQDHRQRVAQGQIKRAADVRASITKHFPDFARMRVV